MSMTLEEAKKYFEMKVSPMEKLDDTFGPDYEAFKVAISALNSPTREIVEKMRGEWIEDEGENLMHTEKIYLCSRCNNFEAWGETEKTNFCPACGAPMTDEAVDMMLKRMEEIYK